MVLGVPRTVLKNMNLSGNLTFFKHIFLLPIELPIELPIVLPIGSIGLAWRVELPHTPPAPTTLAPRAWTGPPSAHSEVRQ